MNTMIALGWLALAMFNTTRATRASYLDTSTKGEAGHSPVSPPDKLSGSCSMLWPRTGDYYATVGEVFIDFQCFLDQSAEAVKQHLAMQRNITILSQMYSINMNNSGFSPQFSRAFQYMPKVSSNILCSHVVIGITDLHLESGPLRIDVHAYINEYVVGTSSVIINFVESSFFNDIGSSTLPSCDFNATSQSCDAGSEGTLSPRYYDFVEIGTSGYDTLIEAASDWHVGLSVEVMKELQDTLPDRAGVTKVNAAIGDEAGWRDFYYFPKQYLTSVGIGFDHPLTYLYGLGMIGRIHPMFCAISRQGSTEAVTIVPKMLRKMVYVTPVGQLFAQHGVSAIGFLKIDTEGMDNKIMQAALNYFEAAPQSRGLPVFIEFENNFDPMGYASVAQRLIKLNYRVYDIRFGVATPTHDPNSTGVHQIVLAERDYSRFAGGDVGVELVARLKAMLPRHLFSARNECTRYFNESIAAIGSDRPAIVDLPFPYFCSLLYKTRLEDEADELLSVRDSMYVEQ